MSQMIESFLHPAPPLRAQPIEVEEAGQVAPDGAALLRDAHPLHAVKVRLHVCIGHAALTIGDLLGARENEVLVLDRTVDQPVDLVLEGKVVARGELVAVDDGSFAVRICELPLPMRL
jgi:flagellar motor switch protein FliN